MDDKNKIISLHRKNGFDVTFYGEECVLRRYTGSEEVVYIPDDVSVIGEYAFYDNKKVKRVFFGDNIHTIQTSAFEDCSSLEEISPLSSVKHIYPYSFSYTIRLSEVILSEVLSDIGEYAFCGSGLRSISVPDSVFTVEYKAFFACPKLERASLGGRGAFYGESVFANCKAMTVLEVSGEVRELGYRAFSYCKNLKSVTVGKNTSLSEDVFEAVECEITYI